MPFLVIFEGCFVHLVNGFGIAPHPAESGKQQQPETDNNGCKQHKNECVDIKVTGQEKISDYQCDEVGCRSKQHVFGLCAQASPVILQEFTGRQYEQADNRGVGQPCPPVHDACKEQDVAQNRQDDSHDISCFLAHDVM